MELLQKYGGHTNIALGANLGDLHLDNLRVILCDFTVSASVPDGTELDVLQYQLKYNLPSDIQGESLTQEIDPKVKTLHAVQVAAEMDDRIVDLINHHTYDYNVT